MKAFFGSFFGALLAILFLLGVSVLVVIGLIGIASSNQKGPEIPKQSLMVLDLTVPIMDAPKEFNPSQLFSELTEDKDQSQVTLRDVLRAIKAAAGDDRIKGFYLTGSLPLGIPYASSYPALKEIREALTKFKESKKPVFAYTQLPFSSTYYLDSVADKVFIDPQAEFILRGPASSPVYYSGLFKKYGIGVQVFRVGKYKSFVEPYLRDSMSPENREQLGKLFGDIWTDITTTIEQSRKLPEGSLNQLINQYGLIDGDLALKSKLGDEMIAQSEIIDRFKRDYGSDTKNNTFSQVTIGNYLEAIDNPAETKSDPGAKIAVIYAEGEIVDGEGTTGNVGGDRYARQIRKFRDDPAVKAIVLRVNSPGGSALASEIIYRELKSVGAVKPVIVSMGGYAASGGYYISSPANKVFAEPTTITGSIGVFGLQFNFEKLATDNGLTTDSITTTQPLATLFNPLKAKSDQDLAILQKAVDKFYQQFLNRVSTGRNLTVEQVNELAQGRVWSGVEAAKIKLVDEIGGLRSAIEYAGKTVQLGDQPRLTEFPARKDLNAKLQEIFKSVPRPPVAKADAFDTLLNRVQSEIKKIRALNDPEGVYARFPADVQWN